MELKIESGKLKVVSKRKHFQFSTFNFTFLLYYSTHFLARVIFVLKFSPGWDTMEAVTQT
jgi:hypothetical protein